MSSAFVRRVKQLPAMALLLCALLLAGCGAVGAHRDGHHHAARAGLSAAAASSKAFGAAAAIPAGTPPIDAVYGPPVSALSGNDLNAEIPAGEDITGRWFASSSPWNTVVADLPSDPRSNQLLHGAMERVGVVEQSGSLPPKTDTVFTNAGLYINTVAWTDPVVQGGPETPIHCRQLVCGDDHGITELPIPADASPNPYYDGWFTVISPDGRTAYDMWRARRLPNGAISFQYMRIWNLAGPGYGAPSRPSARGSGLPLFAGLIRPAELSAGEIDHALAIAVPAPAQRYYVQPASTTDGNGATDALPEGARIRLKPNAKLSPEFPLTAQQRRYASALMWTLRTYGAIVVGRAAVPTLYGQEGVTAGMLAGNELQSLTLTDFQVVQMPAELQYPAASTRLANVPAIASTGSADDALGLQTTTTSPGELVIDGSTSGSLSAAAVRDYRAAGGPDSVTIENHGTATAFDELCSGKIDVVDSATQMTTPELTACQHAGVRPVQLQVASDAAVLATENETDVGADCVTLGQAQAIFRAGSPVSNWAQLGFDTVPLAVAGPQPQADAVGPFGASLVGASQPTLLDFRYDYKAEPTEDAIRQFVVGSSGEGELASSEMPQQDDTVANVQRLLAGARATDRGAATWATEAAFQVKKGIADKRSTAAQAQDAANLTAAKAKRSAAAATVSQLRSELASAETAVAAGLATEAAGRRELGHLGIFQYSYYTLYEQQLRPLEISAAADPENCVFPSQDTITSGLYPLSRQLLLTVSLQQLRRNEGLRLFLESYLGNASALASAAAMVPLPSNLMAAEQQWLSGSTASASVAKGGSGAAVLSATGQTTAAGAGSANSMSAAAAGGASESGYGIPTGVH